MGKVKFSHDIEESLRQEFDTLADQLPGKKHEVVEAMILAFKTLPGQFQVSRPNDNVANGGTDHVEATGKAISEG